MTEDKGGVPMGFGMALASRPDALLAFISMPSHKRKEWVEKAEHAESKKNMNQVVEDMVKSTPEIR